MADENQQLRGVVRIIDADVFGQTSVFKSLRRVKGVGFSFAHALCEILKIDRKRKIGSFSDKEVKQIEDIIRNPLNYKIPAWMLNRQSDPETGKDTHLLSGELQFTVQNDIKKMKMIKSYKGIRHGLGLPVRGQRTKSNFRRDKTVGVKKGKKMGSK